LIGRRLVDDKRNQLVFHFFRLVSELRPRYFVMENVPGMARGGHASILDRLIDEFENMGYRFADDKRYRILNAADFGVPQERHRLFLIGTRDDQKSIAAPPDPAVNPVPKRFVVSRIDTPGTLPSGPTVADAISDLPNLNRFPSLLRSDEVWLSEESLHEMEIKASSYARRLRGLDEDPLDLARPRAWNRSLLTGSARTDHTGASVRRFRRTKPGETEAISRFYRLDPHGLCNTLRAGSGSERGAFTSPRPLHPFVPRVLSNREAARLHSFPDWFRVHTTKWHGFRQIGNAVAPLVGRAVGQQITAALGVMLEKPEAPYPAQDLELIEFTMSDAIAYFGVDRSAAPPPRSRRAAAPATKSARGTHEAVLA
jgi:DNA (cytosine-5)-methyltransferase 1